MTDLFDKYKFDITPGIIDTLTVNVYLNIIKQNTEGRLPTKPEELVKIVTHEWTATKDIIAASDTNLLYIFEPATGKLKGTIILDENVFCDDIVVTYNYYVLGCNDGKIRWVSVSEGNFVECYITLSEDQYNKIILQKSNKINMSFIRLSKRFCFM